MEQKSINSLARKGLTHTSVILEADDLCVSFCYSVSSLENVPPTLNLLFLYPSPTQATSIQNLKRKISFVLPSTWKSKATFVFVCCLLAPWLCVPHKEVMDYKELRFPCETCHNNCSIARFLRCPWMIGI
jgi:hypothetical protein